jgi:hypothetical protein
MENVDWDDELSFLSQHAGFNTTVRRLIAQNQDMGFLYPRQDTVVKTSTRIRDQLAKRHCIRAATFYLAGYGAEEHTSAYDTVYEARDNGDLKRSNQISSISSTLLDDYQYLPANLTDQSAEQIWSILHDNKEAVIGTSELLDPEIVCYDRTWLLDTSSVLRKYWCRLHEFVGCRQHSINKYDMIFCFAAMALSASKHYNAIQILAAVVSVKSLRAVRAPHRDHFLLGDGDTFNDNFALECISDNRTPYYQSPGAELGGIYGEDEGSLFQRRHRTFEGKQEAAKWQFLLILQGQWPCENPTAPHYALISTYIDVASALGQLQPKWRSWFQNNLFREYLSSLSRVLDECPSREVTRPVQFAVTHHLLSAPPYVRQDVFFRNYPSSANDARPNHDLDSLIILNAPAEDYMASFMKRISLNASRASHKAYNKDLQSSHQKLESSTRIHLLTEHLSKCRQHFTAIFEQIEHALDSDTSTSRSCQ